MTEDLSCRSRNAALASSSHLAGTDHSQLTSILSRATLQCTHHSSCLRFYFRGRPVPSKVVRQCRGCMHCVRLLGDCHTLCQLGATGGNKVDLATSAPMGLPHPAATKPPRTLVTMPPLVPPTWMRSCAAGQRQAGSHTHM